MIDLNLKAAESISPQGCFHQILLPVYQLHFYFLQTFAFGFGYFVFYKKEVHKAYSPVNGKSKMQTQIVF